MQILGQKEFMISTACSLFFDDDNVVILFNGFKKKTQKTPESEIEKALKLKKEYYEQKQDI